MEQDLANLIQSYEQVITCSRRLYNDSSLKDWAIQKSLIAQSDIVEAIEKLKEKGIDFRSEESKKQVIKEGSEVTVLVNHMDGMKGSKAIVKAYSLPAMTSDIEMMDGMKMKNHKWLTNDEVELSK